LDQIKRVNGKPTFDFYFTLNTEKSIIFLFFIFKIVNTEKKKLLKLYFNGLEKEKRKKEKGKIV
jgi:hypothetical protein